MKRNAMLAFTLAVTTLSAASAFADSFSFSFAGATATGSPATPFSGSGIFNATLTSTPGQYQIVGITGTTEGATIASLTAVGGFSQNDNLLFVNGGVASLDNAGVAYKLSNGVNVSLFFGVPGQYQQMTFGFAGGLISQAQSTPVTITAVAPTPEPSSLALLGTGALGLAGVIRRRLTR